ncbi:bifunctional 5,10-methylenetetrahydrofolate dehydrogenase/5,10-methenyltetrahydrofolate cyclohydrolase [Candidatus Sneabacter namystus]|uniref:Bifunctional protein FolD n=1 Tax=Candidatus Sneabacter namystus TaxID=2601646 RepID=A0A5C0UJ76_9RICK|nr:tetrahydrofolate dehydrogenase/cyclohydrolase catalytic domain-containing protein [Candidatus Sneabacter namystus]QEK39849.1 bifunctional methylenetetrahydrofolate dehydrogenase/methenyltetrahydrofolate cyclohydrolase [Candidatus Sneabacter namystus]
MLSKLIDGKKLAKNLLQEVSRVTLFLKSTYDIVPHLAIVIVGNDPASALYVRNKINKAREVGIQTTLCQKDMDCSYDDLMSLLKKLNDDRKIHGVIVQLPLPSSLCAHSISKAIAPCKDVDGLNPVNVGLLTKNNEDAFIPCTPLGCLRLITSVSSVKGKHVVVVGRSNIVGRPLASLLLNYDATVTICHSKTANLANVTKSGDIVIVATGIPNRFGKEYFSRGSTVIDVGISRVGDVFVGDVDFQDVNGYISTITPVPGGVGPMTVAFLLANTVKSACLHVKDNSYKVFY